MLRKKWRSRQLSSSNDIWEPKIICAEIKLVFELKPNLDFETISSKSISSSIWINKEEEGDCIQFSLEIARRILFLMIFGIWAINCLDCQLSFSRSL
jgi:hypothetical protein